MEAGFFFHRCAARTFAAPSGDAEAGVFPAFTPNLASPTRNQPGNVPSEAIKKTWRREVTCWDYYQCPW
jgi:hypothetical protein